MEVRPAWLPVIVAAIAVPIVAGFVLAGPAAGLAVGAFAAAAIVLVAIRATPSGPIEVASAAGDRPRLLVVIDDPIEEPAGAERVAAAARSLEPSAATDEPEVLVVAPARNRPLAHWLSDVGEARLDAQRRLVLTVGSLVAAGLDARGEVGDPDPMQAIEDALRRFAADEVLLAAEASERADSLVAQLRRRLTIPVNAHSARVGHGGPGSL